MSRFFTTASSSQMRAAFLLCIDAISRDHVLSGLLSQPRVTQQTGCASHSGCSNHSLPQSTAFCTVAHKTASLTSKSAVHCLILATSPIATYNNIHVFRKRAAVRYQFLQPASRPSWTLSYYSHKQTNTQFYATVIHRRRWKAQLD